jgi:hypothetical protein
MDDALLQSRGIERHGARSRSSPGGPRDPWTLGPRTRRTDSDRRRLPVDDGPAGADAVEGRGVEDDDGIVAGHGHEVVDRDRAGAEHDGRSHQWAPVDRSAAFVWSALLDTGRSIRSSRGRGPAGMDVSVRAPGDRRTACVDV